MDAQSNSSKQDSSDRPSNTPNLSFEPRRMSVAQKALAPFAHLRSIQQQYGPSSAEAFGAQQQAEQTVQRSGSTKDLDNVTANAQKNTSSSSQTPGAPIRQVPGQAKRLTRFEVEYNARRLAAAIEGPKFDSLLSQAQNQTHYCSAVHENPALAQTQNTCQLTIQTSNQERQVEAKEGPASSNLTVQNAPDVQPSTKVQTPYYISKLAVVQRKIRSMELSMAKGQFDRWNAITPTLHVAIEMEFERRLQDFTKSQGVELRDVVFIPIQFCKSRAEAQAHYEALLAEFRNTYKTRQVAAADVAQAKVEHQAQPPKQDESLTQAPPQDPVRTQSCPDMSKNSAPAQTQNNFQLTIQTSNQERQVEAEEGASSSNQAVQHPVPTQNQNAQNDTSDTYKTKTVPDVQRKIKSWELSMAKTQFEEWNDIPNTWNLAIEMEFERRLQDFAKSQGVELQDVVFTPIQFCKSRADAQDHYETLLAEFRNTYKTRQVAAAVAQAKVDHQVQAPKQASSKAQNPIQSSPEMPKNPRASAQNQAPPQDPAQTQSTSEKTEEPASAQTQVSNQKGQAEAKKGTALSNLPMTCSESQNLTQDNIPLQTQKDTPQHPAETHAAPKAQTPAQAPIKTKTPPQAKSQTPHPKLAYVQSTVKLNELALAKVQVDNYNECNPEYWARMEKHFVKRIEAIAKSHGVDPRDVVINSVPLAKSQAEAQAQYKTLYNMAREAGHSNIVAEHTALEITSQKGCLTQDNLLNQIALLKMELAETKGSQDQTLKEFDAKSEKTCLEHLEQVDNLQKRIKMGQVENQLLSSKLSEEQSTSERLRASLEEAEKEVERLKKALKAKSEQKVRVRLPSAQLPDKSKSEVEKTVSPTVSQIIALNKAMAEEQAKANAQRHAEVLASIQTTVQESFKAAAENKVKVEAEEKAKIEAKAQIYALAYVKAKNEAKAKARAEAEAKIKAQREPLCSHQSYSCAETLPKTQSEVQVKNLQKVIDQLIKSHRNSTEKYLEQIRCLEYDIQKLTEDTDYKIEGLKKEVAEKDDKILELQKELWKVIDERQEARLDVEKLAMQLCTNNW